MPYGQAKKHIEKKVAPEIKEHGGILINASYAQLLKKFDAHTKKASAYIGHTKNPEHDQDKQDYLAQIKNSTDKFLQKKGIYKEFIKYSANINIQSNKLHEKIKEKIKQREKEKYNEISKKNLKFISEGKFDKATNSLLALRKRLSPFNITDKKGNIGEAFLRIDKKIEEKVTKFKLQKNLHTQVFVKGNILVTPNERIYIEGIENGKVKYANIKGKSVNKLKNKDYKQVSWLMFFKKYKPGKFDLKRGKKSIDIKTDPKLAESKAHIAELKMLKQISFMYSGKLEKFAKTKAEKILLRNALEENLGEMSLFFMKDSKGAVVPTQVYKTLPQSVKAKKLAGMLQGFQRIRMRMSLEEQEKKETNPNKVRFLKAEIDFQNGLHLSAYAKFKRYIRDNKKNGDKVVKKQVKHAKGRLRQSSSYVITLAQKYSMACIQEPTGNKSKFHLKKKFREKVTKKLTKVFSQLRKSIQSGKAADLDQAYAQLKDKPEGGLDVKVDEFGARGNTETDYLKRHYSFVKTMITTISQPSNSNNQEDELYKFGVKAHKDKYRGGARILFEEQMKRKLIKQKRKLMKDPAYRKKIRDRFMRFKLNSERKTLSSAQVAKLLTKKLLDSNKTHAHSRSFLDDLKTLKQFEEKNIGFINKTKKGVAAAVGISNGHFNSIKRTLDTLDIPSNKKISKYEDFNPFAKTAGIYQRAAHDAGGLNKYMKLSLEKKKIFYEAARIKILLAQHENIEHTINVHAYVKQEMAGDKEMNQRTNPVVYKYNDAYDPNNELFNISDEGWDFVESLVGEVPLMAASGGIGNVAAIGIKQGAKYAAKKLAQRALKRTILRSMTFRLGVRGTAVVADLAISEVVDRGMRYILRGEPFPTDIAQLFAHGLGTYGSMKYASQAGQRLLRDVAKKGMVGKIASHAISTAAIEAPCMMAVNNLFGQAEGSILEQYGRSLATMLASKGSMSMLHSSTGRIMLKAEQDYEIKDSINKIPDQQKRNILNKMINKGEINMDQLGTIMSGNLNYKQIRKIRGLLNNPKSINFLLAYEYAKSHGVKNQDLTHQRDYLIEQLIESGLSKADAEAYLRGVEENTRREAGKPKEFKTFLKAQKEISKKRPEQKHTPKDLINGEKRIPTDQRLEAISQLSKEDISKLGPLNKNQTAYLLNLTTELARDKVWSGIKILHSKFGDQVDIKNKVFDSTNHYIKFILNVKHQRGRRAVALQVALGVQSVFPNFVPDSGIKIDSDVVKRTIGKFITEQGLTASAFQGLQKKAFDSGMKPDEFNKLVTNEINEGLTLLRQPHRPAERNLELLQRIKVITKSTNIDISTKLLDIAQKAFKKNNFKTAASILETFDLPPLHKSSLDNPYQKKLPDLEQIMVMGQVFKVLQKIKVKHKRKLSSEELHKKILDNLPDSVKSKLTPGQKKVIQNFLDNYKTHQSETERIRKMGPEERKKYAYEAVKDEYTQMDIPLSEFKVKVSVVEGPSSGPQVVIILSKETYLKIQIKQYGADFIAAGQNGSISQDGKYVKKGTIVNYIMEGSNSKILKHEITHGISKLLGVDGHTQGKIKPFDALDKGNHEKYFDLAFKQQLQHMADELISMSADGSIEKQGLTKFWGYFHDSYVNYWAKSVPGYDGHPEGFDQAYISAAKKHLQTIANKHKFSVMQSAAYAQKISRYPDGVNLLQITNITQWGPLLKKLQGAKIEIAGKNPDTKAKQAEILKKAGFKNEAASILKGHNFLGSTGHPIHTIAEVKTAVRQLTEFKKLKDSLTKLGLEKQLGDIKTGRTLDTSIPNDTPFKHQLLQARVLAESHQQLTRLQAEIAKTCPPLKPQLKILTDYSASGVDSFGTFASRIKRAESLLLRAKQFEGTDVHPHEQGDISTHLRNHDTQDALTNIILKYGDDPTKIEGSKEWKALAWKTEEAFPSVKSDSLHRALNNEMQRIKNVYEQSFLNSSPVETKATVQQRVIMADFFKDFADLKLDTKHNLKPKELMAKVLEKNPELKKRLTPRQLELIESKLSKLSKHYSEIKKIKSMNSEQQKKYTEEQIKTEYPNFDFSADFKFKIHFGGHTGSTIYIYFPRSTFIQMQYSERFPGKKWGSLTKQEQNARLKDPQKYGIETFGALNMVGNVVFMNNQNRPLTQRNKKTEIHEDVHTATFLSGAKDSPKWKTSHYDKLLSEGRYEEYTKLRFQEEYTGVCDEIVAKIIDGTTQGKIMDSFENTYWKHYTQNILPRIPAEHQHKVVALHAKALREFRTIFKRAHYYGEKIKTYPNGENILRFTPPQQWGKMYRHLKTKHGYGVLTNNIEQTLSVGKEQAFKCASGEIYISGNGKEKKIVKDQYGYAIERNGQLIDLVDGQTTEFSQRRNETPTLEIRVEGNRIFITNLSNKANRIDVYEGTPK